MSKGGKKRKKKRKNTAMKTRAGTVNIPDYFLFLALLYFS